METAIQYLRTKLLEDNKLSVIDIFEHAREIEKQMIINAYNAGYTEEPYTFNKAEIYYNETYIK